MFLTEGLTAKGKPRKDQLDLRGHSNAINYLLGFIRDKERAIAELVAAKLGSERVFLDEWFEHKILGSDMDVLL